jgi:hypothetical protein
VAGLGIGGWATGTKVAAGAVVVAVVAAGAGGYAVSSSDSGPASQIAPAISSGGARQPAVEPAGSPQRQAAGGAPSGDVPAPDSASPASGATAPATPEPSIPGDPDQPGTFVVPPSTYPDGGSPPAGETTTSPSAATPCDPHDPACTTR